MSTSTERIVVRSVNWLGDQPISDLPEEGFELYAKVRSTRPPLPAVLRHRDGSVWIELGHGESGVAPGQACVLYDGEGNDARVLGGGFIERSERGAEAEAMLAKLIARRAPSPAA